VVIHHDIPLANDQYGVPYPHPEERRQNMHWLYDIPAEEEIRGSRRTTGYQTIPVFLAPFFCERDVPEGTSTHT
jgi:hypothetical protein